MLSVQPSNPAVNSNEKATRPRPINLVPPSPRPLSTPGMPMPSPRLMTPTSSMRPTSELLGSANKLPAREVEALDQWFANFQTYEATLEEMATASTEPKFKEELSTIEHWFKILSEPERTATLYTLLQHSSQVQIRFLIAVLQQMIKSDANPPPTASIEGQMKGKAHRSGRPPSLNLPEPGSAHSALPSALESATLRSAEPSAQAPKSGVQGQDIISASADDSWASMVKTPSTPMFGTTQTMMKQEQPLTQFPGFHPAMGTPGFPGNPFNLNMIGSMGLSPEAQILAVQMMMGGFAQSGQMQMPQPQPHRNQSGSHSQRQPRPSGSNNWRAPSSARYPGSALKSSGLKSSGLKSSGLKSSGLKSAASTSSTATPTATPREEDFDPELLKDIPAWLKTFRLHKYTPCFDGMTWQEMVVLDDATLEAKGVVTLGARRRLLRTFEMVRNKMGLESPPSADASSDPSSSKATDSTTPTVVTAEGKVAASPVATSLAEEA